MKARKRKAVNWDGWKKSGIVRRKPTKKELKMITKMMDAMPGWERDEAPRDYGPYGFQRGWHRVGVIHPPKR